jgi:hypothetical protein
MPPHQAHFHFIVVNIEALQFENFPVYFMVISFQGLKKIAIAQVLKR